MRIGLIGLEALGARLAADGFEVVSGATVIDSAKAVRLAVSDADNPLGHVIVAASLLTGGIGAAMVRLSSKSRFVAIGDAAAADLKLPEHFPCIPFPADLSQVLSAVGLSGGDFWTVYADGSVIDPLADEPAPAPVAPVPAFAVEPVWASAPAEQPPAPAPVEPPAAVEPPERLFQPLHPAPPAVAPVPPVAVVVEPPAVVVEEAPRADASWRHLLDETPPESEPENYPPPNRTPPAQQPPPPTSTIPSTLPVAWEPSTPSPAPTPAAAGALGGVLAPVARKGGVGKTTGSMLLAEYAARHGMKVLLIDANFGQADVAVSLGIPQGSAVARLTDVLAFSPANIVRGVATAAELTRLRKGHEVHFDVLLGMLESEVGRYRGLLTDRYVSEIIEQGRRRYDLVVVDTQIIDEMSLVNVADEVIVPMVRSGYAYIVGITGKDENSAIHLHKKMAGWVAQGVRRERLLSLFNQQSPTAGFDAEVGAPLFRQVSEHIGTVANDEAMASLFATRSFDRAIAFCEPQLRAILKAATGLSAFDWRPPAETGRRTRRFPWTR